MVAPIWSATCRSGRDRGTRWTNGELCAAARGSTTIRITRRVPNNDLPHDGDGNIGFGWSNFSPILAPDCWVPNSDLSEFCRGGVWGGFKRWAVIVTDGCCAWTNKQDRAFVGNGRRLPALFNRYLSLPKWARQRREAGFCNTGWIRRLPPTKEKRGRGNPFIRHSSLSSLVIRHSSRLRHLLLLLALGLEAGDEVVLQVAGDAAVLHELHAEQAAAWVIERRSVA